MMDCRVWLGVKRLSGMQPIVNSIMATKGWLCGVAEEGSDWLGSYTGPHTMEVWTGTYARLVTRIRSLMGKAAHLCRV